MLRKIFKVKGMRDLLFTKAERFSHIKSVVQSILESNGFRRVHTPVVERKQLFSKRVGFNEDHLKKESYEFTDKLSGELLILRPENTAPIVRIASNYNLCEGEPKRLWYGEPMFRRERNQKGRYRQFYQIGAEVLGFEETESEAELVALGNKVLEELGVKNLVLRINSIGNSSDRKALRMRLMHYFSKHKILIKDLLRGCSGDILKFMDSKILSLREVVEAIFKLHETFDQTSLERFFRFQKALEFCAIRFDLAPSLVRGLDYYEHTVFEWHCVGNSQKALAAGGCYGKLMRRFDIESSGFGWALGLDRLEEILNVCPVLYSDIYILYRNPSEWKYAVAIKRELETLNLIITLCPRKWTDRLKKRIVKFGCVYAIEIKRATSNGKQKIQRTRNLVKRILRNLITH